MKICYKKRFRIVCKVEEFTNGSKNITYELEEKSRYFSKWKTFYFDTINNFYKYNFINYKDVIESCLLMEDNYESLYISKSTTVYFDENEFEDIKYIVDILNFIEINKKLFKLSSQRFYPIIVFINNTSNCSSGNLFLINKYDLVKIKNNSDRKYYKCFPILEKNRKYIQDYVDKNFIYKSVKTYYNV